MAWSKKLSCIYTPQALLRGFNINLDMTTISAIIIGTVMISFFGIVIYNKGAKDE